MAETKITYAAAVNLTVTSWGTGLASGQIGSSLIVDNATNLYLDALVGGLLEIGATTPVAGDVMDVYAYGRYDEATAAALTGGIDALFTGADEEEVDGTDLILAHLPLIVSLEAESNIGIHFGPRSIAAKFDGRIPESWGEVLHNNGGATMAAGSLSEYIGITNTSI